MSRRVYRICLVMAIVAAIVGGVLYYELYQKPQIAPKEGTFVWQEIEGDEYV